MDVYEGPLDLLLYLIKKNEVDIYDIPIELITQQYMETLNLMQMLDFNIAGDFLVMASTLMMIKSRMLLPPEERPDLEEEEEDPRWNLIQQLVQYKKFKDAAGSLHELELQQEDMFERGTNEVLGAESDGVQLEDVSIFDLITAFNTALKKVRLDESHIIVGERFTVTEKIEAILNKLAHKNDTTFWELFSNATTRDEIVCTFLALLELIRLKQIRALQRELFGDIILAGVM